MKYSELFSIVLKHEYYNQAICRDFDIQPLNLTAKMIKRYKLQASSLDDRIGVWGQVDGNDLPLRAFPPQTTFFFSLVLKNKYFRDLTESDYQNMSSDYYFNNKTGGQLLTKDPTPLPENLTLPIFTFGVIGIENNASLPLAGGTPPTFTFTFQAKTQVWDYYVISENNADSYEIKAYQETPFQLAGVQSAITTPIGKALVKKHPNLKVHHFQSPTILPLKEEGKKGLQLLRNGTPIIANLPSISPKNSYQIINVSRIYQGISII